MKNFISNLVAYAATVLFTFIIGMDVASVVSAFVAFFLVEHLMFEVYGHIKAKEMPSVKQWIQYAFEFIALVLVSCGINYKSIYTLIAGLIFVIAAVVMGFVVNKKVEEVEGEAEEVEAETEEVKEEVKKETSGAAIV